MKTRTVDVWYDRYSRSWVVQEKDADDNQVGDAIYVHTKREAEIERNEILIRPVGVA